MRNTFSSKANGSMKKDDGTVDLKNIEAFLRFKNFPLDAVCMEQVHGGTVAMVTGTQKIIPGVDALVSNKKGLTLCVVTADCLPILLYDPEEQVIGAVHAGRKGLLRNVIFNTINEFKKLGSSPKNIQVAIGPSIEKSCYEVGREPIEEFGALYPWMDKMFVEDLGNGKYLLDLRAIAQQCLLKEGILKEYITVSDQCTKCMHETFFSYRGGDTYGRFVSVVSLT